MPKGFQLTAEEMFNLAYANINMAAELSQQMADVNVGNLTRQQILNLKKLVQDANASLTGLDEWRKKFPHHDERGE